MASQHDVTRLLHEWANGAQSALEALTPLVYAELRRLAANYLRNEAPGHTLQPTALVHEAFLRMVGRNAPDCQNRSEFYGMAAHLMRQILIDHARTRHAGKRGGRVAHLSLEEDLIGSRGQDADLMALDIGPATIDLFAKEIAEAHTILWNGPMGVFELAPFAHGTNAIAEFVAANADATSIVGGGDSVAAVRQAGVADKITHISTGGGASLEFLEGKTLPGVAALTDK